MGDEVIPHVRRLGSNQHLSPRTWY
jgi:hypothetical protein